MKVNVAMLNDEQFLGYGYDVTGRYCHPLSVRGKIVNLEKFFEENPDNIQCLISNTSDMKLVVAENSMEYCANLSASVKLEGEYKGFSGALNTKFSYKNKCDAKYSFGSYFFIIRERSLSLYADAKKLQPYLNEGFLKDLRQMSAKKLIESYGTHVITNYSHGGRVEILCRSVIQRHEKTAVLEAGVKAAYEKFVSLDSDGKYDKSLIDTNKEMSIHIETIGGETHQSIENVSLSFDADGKGMQNNFTRWKSSVTSENAVLVDMRENSLISIASLVPDDVEYAERKKELTETIERYLRENEFKIDLLVPLYRYYNAGIDDHFYTTDGSELHLGKSGYVCERVACMVYAKEMKNTVPLRRYFSTTTNDHFYSIDLKEHVDGKWGYVYEGVCGYVYDSDEYDPALVPLYRGYLKSVINRQEKLNHFYSLDKSEGLKQNNYTEEGIACYVYKPTKEQARITEL